ncbi:IclR family transcriptional regulator, partial [Salmonella sp. zj-f60]|nr:IclR family transcriptional regulator [Salmonella sp. zj-f60]
RNRAGDIIAAMNISGQANRTSGKQMTKQFLGPLQQAAERISAMVRVRT